MYQHVMVPMDGSELAECVLPHVESIAGGCHVSRVTLVRVVEPLRIPGGMESRLNPEERQHLEANDMNIAKDYLEQVSKRLAKNGISVESVVLFGHVAEQLVNYEKENGVDLVIIATHGHSGVKRWVWGSVTDKILKASSAPLLVVRVPGYKPKL